LGQQGGPALENARNAGGRETLGNGQLIIHLADSCRGAEEGVVGIARKAAEAGIAKAPISIAAVVVEAIVEGIVEGRLDWRN